jgi:hypothetical protein
MQELRLFSAEELAWASAQIAHTFGEAHETGLPADAALRGAGEKFADMVMERAWPSPPRAHSTRWST